MLTPNEIVEKIYEGKRKYIKVYPVHKLRASEVGHPASATGIFNHWQERAPRAGKRDDFRGRQSCEDLAVGLGRCRLKVYRPERTRAYSAFVEISRHIGVRDFSDGVQRN